jgi:hypothetical protein
MLLRNSPSRKALFRPGVSALMYGLVVLAALIVVDRLSINYGLKESQRVLDDLCGAIIAGLLVYRYEHSRSKYLNEKLKTIELMNHHVRNALQNIVGSVHLHGHAQQLDEIRTSVRRIDWALREILPGRVLDNYDEDPEKKQSPRSAA